MATINDINSKMADDEISKLSKLSTKEEELRSLTHKWRVERQARLMTRLMHKRPDQTNVSTAVFGTMEVGVFPTEIPTQEKKPVSDTLTSCSNLPAQSSIKGKAKRQKIVVKHTLASRLRLEKANPLLRTDLPFTLHMPNLLDLATHVSSPGPSLTPAKKLPSLEPKRAQNTRCIAGSNCVPQTSARKVPVISSINFTHGTKQASSASKTFPASARKHLSNPNGVSIGTVQSGSSSASHLSQTSARKRLVSCPSIGVDRKTQVCLDRTSQNKQTPARKNLASVANFGPSRRQGGLSGPNCMSQKLPMDSVTTKLQRRSTLACSGGRGPLSCTPAGKPVLTKVPSSEPKGPSFKVPRRDSVKPVNYRPVSSRLYPVPKPGLKENIASNNQTVGVKKLTNKSNGSNSVQNHKVTQPITNHSKKLSQPPHSDVKRKPIPAGISGVKKPTLNCHNSNVRRSLSTVHVKNLGIEQAQKSIKRCRSEPDVSKRAAAMQLPNHGVHSPILEEMEDTVQLPNKMFCRSKSVTFFSPLSRRTMSPVTSVFTPKPAVLRKRLLEWLEKRGKSLGSFHHLHCFGLRASDMKAQHSNVGTPRTSIKRIGSSNQCNTPTLSFKPILKPSNTLNLDKTVTLESSSESKEDACAILDGTIILSSSNENDSSNTTVVLTPVSPLSLLTSTPENPKEECAIFVSPIGDADKENAGTGKVLVTDTLADLHCLILSGYSWDQCEQWLALIRATYSRVKETFQYWECLAAIEEARCDYSSAVDCYERAIVRGAQPDAIEKSLDQLWEKFSALNIKSGPLPTERASNCKSTVAKNIFKSSIIKFALQQRSVKKLSCDLGMPASSLHYVVTPVRRSTRKSYSQFRSTPSVTCFSTVDDLEPEVRSSMVFQSNTALEPKVL